MAKRVIYKFDRLGASNKRYKQGSDAGRRVSLADAENLLNLV
jgi:hypothetical protein